MSENELEEKNKILEKENAFFKCFVSQILIICDIHLQEIKESNNAPLSLCLSDFTLGYNLHSFVEFFMDEYTDATNTLPKQEIVDGFKEKWSKDFAENVSPKFREQVVLRTKLLGAIEEVKKVREEDEETARLYS